MKKIFIIFTSLIILLVSLCGCVTIENNNFLPINYSSAEDDAQVLVFKSEYAGPLELGETTELSFTLDNEVINADSINLSSSDTDIINVADSGTLLATGVGEAVVSATLKDNSRVKTEMNFSVQFSGDVYAVLSQNTYILDKGQSLSLEYTVSPVGADADISFISEDDNIATVDLDGTVTGVSAGSSEVMILVDGEPTDRALVCVSSRSGLDRVSPELSPRYSAEGGIIENANADNKDEISVMIAGDIMSLPSQQKAALSDNTYNFNRSFECVKDIIAESDFAIANLETLTSPSTPYAIEEQNINGKPNCNSPETILDALLYAGFDSVVTANNHCCDGGKTGIFETLANLDEYSVPHTGTFAFPEDQRYILADVCGIKIAVLAYTEYYNGKNSAIPSEEQSYMLNTYSKGKVESDVAAAKAAGAEFIIAYNHWGIENTNSVDSRQIIHAQEMADAGVDLIAGSHPHVVQRAEYITAADGRKVFVIYSLGNFLSCMRKTTMNNDAVLLNLTLAREGDKVIIKDAGYYGLHCMTDYNGGKFILVPVNESCESENMNVALMGARQRINGIMQNEALYEITN